MPANHQKPAHQPPASPRNAKYTNKDGSKFITVPKGASDSSQPSTPTASKTTFVPTEPLASPEPAPAPAVNRKKQKRRQKAAAKAAAEQAQNGHIPQAPPPADDYEEVNSEDEEYEYVHESELTNGHPTPDSSSKKSKKKKKKKNASSDPGPPPPHQPPPHHPPPHAMTPGGAGMSRDKIWSTSNQEERERIKEFWLGLGEEERKSLVKVEKDAVLKKMKEQQKHTCSCTVCGRKRTAIEEELEGLYDAYYLELEQFANQGEGPPMLPPRDFSTPFRSPYPPQPPSRGRIVEHVGDDDEEEEVYSDDEVDEEEYEYSDDEPPSEPAYHPHERDVTDFLTFGNSLQVKGGILTVADDLLKNDGKRFIEMMEQLAERRMAREEDAREHFSRGYGHPNGSYSAPHNHPPPDDDYDEEEEDEEEDYDDSQDEEYDEEEDVMTEEQRMEEGRRMFQIFAARMFEQRVLSAYKEKVAKERQAKLLEELEEEDRREDQQKARKAKNAAKKKEKAAEKKKALAEEKARREAEKAAEEAARLEAEQQRAAEQRRKAEEKRKQKELQKKAEEEARLKKEADRQRRIHEQREKQAEQERKAREAKDREKKLKEEQKIKEKELREQKEREALERKEKQERDKREKEARAAKAQKEAQEAKEAREKAKEERAKDDAHKTAAAPVQPSPPAKRGQAPITVPIMPQHPTNPANYASPKIPVATPIMSKLPTPMRARTLSQQQGDSASASQPGSIPSQEASPHPESNSQTSPRPIGQQRKESGGAAGSFPNPTHTSSPASGMSGHPTPVNFPPPGMAPPPGFGSHPPPGFPGQPMMPPGFRPPGMMPPPGMNGPGGRVFSPGPMPPPGFAPDHFPPAQNFPMAKEGPLPHAHQRQGSASFDAPGATPAQPIGRPAPIGRPGSINHRSQGDKEDDTQHLGSRALLEDDEPIEADVNPGSYRTQPPGPRPSGFGTSPFGVDTGFNLAHNPWGPSPGGPASFGPPGFPAPPTQPTWGAAPAMSPAFGMTSPTPGFSPIRPPGGGLFGLRALVCHACRELAGAGPPDAEGFVDVPTLKRRIEERQGAPVDIDLSILFDTEGNASNGGGTFETKEMRGTEFVRWSPEGDGFSQPRSVGAPGQIGSPAAVRGM